MPRSGRTPTKSWRFRARLAVERLEDRCVPSAHLFDPFPSFDDLFAVDPALADEAPQAHASGDLNAAFPHADNAIPTTNLSQTTPAADTVSQGLGTAPSSQGPAVDPQFLAVLQANTPARVRPSTAGAPGVSGLQTKVSPLALPPPSVELDGPANVPVNADNDNGSNVTNGIPTQRDFNVNPLPKADPDLLQGTVTALNVAGGGTWTRTLTQIGGQIKLWTDAKKSAAFTTPPAGQLTATFYIEGFHESVSANDVKLSFKYTVNGNSYTSNNLTITVTPLIQSFTVTPGLDAGDANKQNIIFFNGTDGNQGLAALTPKLIPGASFKSVVVKTGLTGNLMFIQNVSDAVNGNNGTKKPDGTPVGWLYQDNTGQIVTLKHPGYPILDVNTGANDQTAVHNFQSVLSADKTTVTITFDDSPRTLTPANPPNPNTGIAVDLLFKARTYVVVEWKQVASNSGGAAIPVFYFLAYDNWQANFWGTTPKATGPITTINVLQGVTADANYTASNQEPPANALNLNRIYNTEFQWGPA